MKQLRLLFYLVIVFAVCMALTYAQKGKPIGSNWKPCEGLPPIVQTGPFSGNLKATPSNPPCYVDITATAEGVTSAPVRIYIKR